MGNCMARDKEEFIKYDRYIYCETCLAKIKYEQIYAVAHCLNKTHIFCSDTCYGHWICDK